jgi:hypothetical protein
MPVECLSKDALRKADDRPIVPLPLDEATYGKGAQVLLRPWSGQVRCDMETLVAKDKAGSADYRWFVAQNSLVDADGSAYLDDKDREWFLQCNQELIEAVFDKACQMNGIGKKELDQREKNSEAGR